MNGLVFEKNHLLHAHYFETVFTQNLAIKGEGWLKADLMVFVRWMDSKEFVRDGTNKLMAKRIEKVWDSEMRPMFVKSYDCLFDMEETGEEMLWLKIVNQRKILSNFKTYLDKTTNGKKAKMERIIFAEWSKIIGNNSVPASGDCMVDNWEVPIPLSEAQENAFQATEKWIQNLHYHTFKQQLGESELFFSSFKKIFQFNVKDYARKLMDFLENKQNAENILRFLGIDFEPFFPQIGGKTAASPGAKTVGTSQKSPSMRPSAEEEFPGVNSPLGSSSSSLGSPSTGTVANASPTAAAKKKAKRNKAKRSKEQSEVEPSPPNAEQQEKIDAFSSGTPKRWAEIQPEKMAIEQADQAVIKEANKENAEEDEAVAADESVEKAPENEAVAADQPVEKAPDDKAVAADQPVEKAPEDEAVAADQPVEKTSVDEAVAADQPVEKAPEDEAVAADQPVEKTSVDEAVAADQPVEKTSVDEAVAADQPVEKTSVDEAVAADQPVEKTKKYKAEIKNKPVEKVAENETIFIKEQTKIATKDEAVDVDAPIEKIVEDEVIAKDDAIIEQEQPERRAEPEEVAGDEHIEEAAKDKTVIKDEPKKKVAEYKKVITKEKSKAATQKKAVAVDEPFKKMAEAEAVIRDKYKKKVSEDETVTGDEPSLKTKNSQTSNLDGAEIDGVTIGDFADKNTLFIKYGELIWHFVYCQSPTRGDSPKFLGQNEKVQKEHLLLPCLNSEQNPSAVRAIIHLLDIGIYVHEIGHRLKAVRLVEQLWPEMGILQSEITKIEGQWAKIKGDKFSVKSHWAELEKHLHKMLEQLLVIMDQKKFPGSAAVDSHHLLKEIRLLKDELHLRNLALSLANECQFSLAKFNSAETTSLFSLFFSNFERMKGRLNQSINWAIKENIQQKIDLKNYLEFCKNKNFKKFIKPKMATNFAPAQFDQMSKLWQNIAFGQDRFDKMSTNDLENNILMTNKYLLFDSNQEKMIENVIKEMNELFKNWSPNINCHFSAECWLRPKVEAKLDAICIMPLDFDISAFLGSCETEIYNEQSSLYCMLSKKENIVALQRIPADYSTSVPQLKFSYKNLLITINGIMVPNLGNDASDGTLNGEQIDKISRKFGDEIERVIRADHFFDEGQFRSSQKMNNDTLEMLANSMIHAVPAEAAKLMDQMVMFDQMNEMLAKDREKAINLRESVKNYLAALKTFSTFGNHIKIREFISDRRQTKAGGTWHNGSDSLFRKFALTLAYLEQWANSNHINGEQIGYLNTNILTVMVTKTLLVHPDAPLPILIEKFFITYSTWPWPLPVQLTEIDAKRKGEFLSWMPGREWFTKRQNSPKRMLSTVHAELAMAIITPTFPEQNLAQNSNVSSVKCIQYQMIKALKTIRNESNKNAIDGPLTFKKFTDMYEHFFVVICVATNYQIDTFANFVGGRLGHELPEIIENPMEKWIKFCHVFVRPISLGECAADVPSPTSPNRSFCKKIWLVGIEMNDHPMKEMSKFKSKLNANNKKKLVDKIKETFGSSFVQLEIDYVEEREQLQKLWGIENLI